MLTESASKMRISRTNFGFHLHVAESATAQINYANVKYGCGFRKNASFWSDFERYSVLGICLWNPQQRRRSKESSKVADSATNLIFACCGIRLQCTECTGWPRNVTFVLLSLLTIIVFFNPCVSFAL